jgi:hypothetical protein
VGENQEVLVNVTRCQTVQRQGVRPVCEVVAENQEVLVNVTRCQTVARQGMRNVCEVVAENQEVMVNVTRCQPVERKGTRARLVSEMVTEVVPTTETYVERVPYQYTVRMPVGGEAALMSGYGSEGGRGGLFGGLFGHKHGK